MTLDVMKLHCFQKPMGAKGCNQAKSQTGKVMQVIKVKEFIKVKKVKNQKVKEVWSLN